MKKYLLVCVFVCVFSIMENTHAGVWIGSSPTTGGTGLSNLNGQTGTSQSFTNETNIGVSSVSNIHTFTWSGLLALTRGGTNQGSWTAGRCVQVNAGGTALESAAAACGSGGGGITSLGGQSGSSQTFTNDTNITISSAANVHTIGWTGLLSLARGGTNQNTWTANRCVRVNSGGTALEVAAGDCSTGGSPAGPTNAVQINNGGGFGDSGCTATSGAMSCSQLTISGAGAGQVIYIQNTAPGAPPNVNEVSTFVDSSDGKFKSHANGGSAKTYQRIGDTIIQLIAAGCDGLTAGTSFDLPTSGAMGKACLGSGVRFGALTAADAVTSVAYAHFRFPDGWVNTYSTDVIIEYTGAINSSNNIRTQVSIACVGDNEDLLSPTFNTATPQSLAGPNTAGQRKTSTFSSVSVTNCTAGESAFLKLERLGGDGADLYTDEARYLKAIVRSY